MTGEQVIAQSRDEAQEILMREVLEAMERDNFTFVDFLTFAAEMGLSQATHGMHNPDAARAGVFSRPYIGGNSIVW